MTQWPHRETVTDQSQGVELPTPDTPSVFVVDVALPTFNGLDL
jgi:hypothetical protein